MAVKLCTDCKTFFNSTEEYDGHLKTCSKTKAPAEEPKEALPKSLDDVLKKAPEVMADLTRQFREKKTLTDRVLVRLRMKAILDLLSVDTNYPANPALNPQQEIRRRRRGRHDGIGQIPMPYAAANPVPQAAIEQAVMDEIQQEQVAPVPGAQRAENNDLMLG